MTDQSKPDRHRPSEEITAQEIKVGDEIKFMTADGRVHHVTVAQLPRSEVHILPQGVARKAENLFTLSPTDSVIRYRPAVELPRSAALRAERLRSFPEDREAGE